MSLPERQAELVETHRDVHDADLPYVLVGGWAVSAFQTRFTTDVDMVIPETALEDYDELLRDRGYTKEADDDVSNVYEGRMIQYEKAVGDYAVEFDALVGALRCRQTDAEWSYKYLHEHSVVESLEVAEDLPARIPEPSLLFSLKLHSGRMADARDLLVLGATAEYDRIERHLHRGDSEKLAERIESVLSVLEQDGFEDSFKGVFRQQELPGDELGELVRFLRTQLDRIQ
jgi:hypothetical protein